MFSSRCRCSCSLYRLIIDFGVLSSRPFWPAPEGFKPDKTLRPTSAPAALDRKNPRRFIRHSLFGSRHFRQAPGLRYHFRHLWIRPLRELYFFFRLLVCRTGVLAFACTGDPDSRSERKRTSPLHRLVAKGNSAVLPAFPTRAPTRQMDEARWDRNRVAGVDTQCVYALLMMWSVLRLIKVCFNPGLLLDLVQLAT